MENSIQRGNVTINNLNRLEELNTRIAFRNIPSSNLQPTLSVRSTPTKYTKFMVNNNIENCVNTQPTTNFTVNSVFLPGDRNGPYAGFSNKINDESYLRNQYFALQNCPQATWVPDSTSELYTYNVDANIKQSNVLQEFPHLFRRHTLGYFNPNPNNKIGINIFNNSTRCQLKDI
tara:strand:+ start:8354 stop:8878 length:525 start_codon:yes stop_codon:yes gene_type:complete